MKSDPYLNLSSRHMKIGNVHCTWSHLITTRILRMVPNIVMAHMFCASRDIGGAC